MLRQTIRVLFWWVSGQIDYEPASPIPPGTHAAFMKPARLAIAQHLCRYAPPLIAQRLRDWIYPREQAYSDAYPFEVRAQTGSYFGSVTNDYHSYPFSVHGYYQWRHWAIARALCASGDTIVEVGGNVGTETVGHSDIVGSSGTVLVFEPLPSNLERLQKNVKRCRYDNVHVYPHAVGEEEKTVRFVVPRVQTSSGSGYVAPETADDPETETIEIQGVRLDDFADEVQRVRLMFMDVEGSEMWVLRGAQGLIQRDVPAIVLEASPKHQTRSGFSVRALHDEITGYGYTLFDIARFGLEPVTAEHLSRSSNWLAIHKSQLDMVSRVERYLRRCGLAPCIVGLNPLVIR